MSFRGLFLSQPDVPLGVIWRKMKIVVKIRVKTRSFRAAGALKKRKIDTNLIALDAGNAIAALLLLDFASQFASRVTMAIWHKHLFFDACNHYPSEYLQANCQAVSLGLTRSCLGSFGGRARKKTWSASSCIISSFENWEQPQKTAWKTTHVVRANCDPQRFF